MCDGNLAMQNEYEHGTLREPKEFNFVVEKCRCFNVSVVAQTEDEAKILAEKRLNDNESEYIESSDTRWFITRE